jgi:uncharacterized Zn finger protein (UPF0148 family)
MYCMSCGGELPNVAAYCPNCGRNVGVAESEEAALEAVEEVIESVAEAVEVSPVSDNETAIELAQIHADATTEQAAIAASAAVAIAETEAAADVAEAEAESETAAAVAEAVIATEIEGDESTSEEFAEHLEEESEALEEEAAEHLEDAAELEEESEDVAPAKSHPWFRDVRKSRR